VFLGLAPENMLQQHAFGHSAHNFNGLINNRLWNTHHIIPLGQVRKLRGIYHVSPYKIALNCHLVCQTHGRLTLLRSIARGSGQYGQVGVVKTWMCTGCVIALSASRVAWLRPELPNETSRMLPTRELNS